MELTSEEKKVLSQIYSQKIDGENDYLTNQIEDILELTADEKRFFDRKNFVSPFFSVQTLYKFKGDISPMMFNRAVLSLIAEEKDFRTNYCNVGKRTLKIVFSEHSGTRSNHLPEIVYRNLSNLDDEDLDDTLTKIMEADRRTNFDLVNNHLIRFSVFRTGEEEYAILFTTLRLISDSFNEESFFTALSNNAAYRKVEYKLSTFRAELIEKSVRDYWTKVLKDLPQIKSLPYLKKSVGEYRERSFRSKIPADISSDVREKAQSNKAMLSTILQSAWGFLLQAIEEVNDVTFCQLVSNLSGGHSSLNVIPVRLQSAKDSSVEKIIAVQFKQSVISRPYSFFDWDNLQSITGHNGQLFDHFLSFLDFQTNQKSYSQEKAESFGAVITKNSWDSHGMKLGVYFQYSNTNLALTFLYDANSFSNVVGEHLANLYNLVLHQMLLYWNMPFKDFMENLTNKISGGVQEVEQMSKEDERKLILHFISANKILNGDPIGIINTFADVTNIIKLFEGDRVSADLLEKNLIFVMEGKLARSLDTGDGWFNALDIISKGGWLNETILLPERRAVISAEVFSDQATLALISYSTFDHILRKYPEIYRRFIKHVLRQMEKYQVLWLQS